METIRAHSESDQKTVLKDRTLWYDGSSSYDPTMLAIVIQKHQVEFVDYMNDLVEEYNRSCYSHEEIRVKTKCELTDVEWVLPKAYASLDVEQYLSDLLSKSIQEYSPTIQEQRIERFFQELDSYRERGLFPILRVIIYIINTLTSEGIVWGVGRGSSVSSYLLYLIGAHDVDSFAYQLDINDFLHD